VNVSQQPIVASLVLSILVPVAGAPDLETAAVPTSSLAWQAPKQQPDEPASPLKLQELVAAPPIAEESATSVFLGDRCLLPDTEPRVSTPLLCSTITRAPPRF
jgi:hypothetical protein